MILKVIDFLLKEWLLSLSIIGFLFTTLYTGKLPTYSKDEIDVYLYYFLSLL